MTTPSNGARTLVFSSASSVTRTRARAETMAASADLHARRRHGGGRLRRGQRRIGRDAVLHQARAAARGCDCPRRATAIACASCASASATARRDASSWASMSACSISAITSPLRTRVPSSKLSAREAAAGLHADVAAVPRHHVTGGDEHRQIGSSRRRRSTDLRRARDLDFGRAAARSTYARARRDTRRRRRRTARARRPRQPAAARRGIAIDAQAREIAGDGGTFV